jgi:hypothetical protein
MTTVEWIIICVAVAICSAFISWVITYAVMNTSKQRKCIHDFTEVLRLDVPGVHKVAYICEKCGKVKKVYL